MLFLFANRYILTSLTKNVSTYDILHLITAVSNNLDGFFTTDKKLVEWIGRNKDLFKKLISEDFKFFIFDTKTLNIQIFSFQDL